MARCRDDEDFCFKEAKRTIQRSLEKLQEFFPCDGRKLGSYNHNMRAEVAVLLCWGIDDPQYWTELTAKAKTDPQSYDACRYAYTFCIENEMPIPDELKVWSTDALYKGKPRSDKRGPDPMRNEGRNIVIAQQVELAHKYFGLPLYDKVSPDETACGLVAECLSEIGFSMTHEAVRSIYKGRQKK